MSECCLRAPPKIWQGTESKFEPLTCSLGVLLLDKLKSRENEICTIDTKTDTQYTCGQIRELAVKCALELRARGLKQGDMITLCPKNHKYSIIPFLAAAFLGVKVSVIHEMFNKNEISNLIKLFNPCMIICDASVEAKLKEVVGELNRNIPIELGDVNFEENFCKPSSLEANFQAENVDINSDFILLCSSGTTGAMKGINHTHKTFYHAVCDTSQVLTKEDRFLSFSPLVWNSQSWQTVYTILFGSIRVCGNWVNSTDALNLIQKYKITYINLNPSKVMDICTNPDFDKYPQTQNIRVVWSRGSPNTVEQMNFYRSKLPNTHVMNAIGCTEMAMMIAFFDPCSEFELNKSKVNSVGRLCPGVKAKIVDPETRTKSLGPNQPGELLLKARCMFSGYYLNPNATKDSFTEDGWYITGDLAQFDDDQCLYIVGRLKEIFKYNTITVTPTAVEYIINQHPGVKDCCVMGLPDIKAGDLPLAFVVKKPGVEVTEDEIVQLVEKQGSDAERLRGGVVFLPSLPYTATGKIRKSELKAIIAEIAAKRT